MSSLPHPDQPMGLQREALVALPKAELHLHIEGSMTPRRMLALAAGNQIELPYADEAAVLEAYQFEDLQSFLDLYFMGSTALQTEDDFYALARDYFEVCHAEHIVHAEIGYDPQGHTERGLPFEVPLKGLRRAMADAAREYGISSRLTMNFLRHLPPASAEATLTQAEAHLDQIDAVGLDSSEVGFPPEPFAKVFARAAELGLKRVAHAGEEGPPAYIWGALDVLGVDRIDHGIRADEDEALLARLVEDQTPLTVCPQSNVRLCAVPDMASHNILRLLERGLRVTVNSDDPSYFGGYLTDNFLGLAQHLDLTWRQAAQLARNSFTASFLSEAAMAPHLAAIDDWLTAHTSAGS